MNSSTLVGALLVVMGALDLVLAFVIIGPRLPEKSRKTVQMSMLIGAVLIIALGCLYLVGSIGGRAGA